MVSVCYCFVMIIFFFLMVSGRQRLVDKCVLLGFNIIKFNIEKIFEGMVCHTKFWGFPDRR